MMIQPKLLSAMAGKYWYRPTGGEIGLIDQLVAVIISRLSGMGVIFRLLAAEKLSFLGRLTRAASILHAGFMNKPTSRLWRLRPIQELAVRQLLLGQMKPGQRLTVGQR